MTVKEFEEKYPDKAFGAIKVRRQHELVNYDGVNYINCLVEDFGTYEFCMEHQCNEWVIGDLEEAKSFLDNLKDAIAYVTERMADDA